MITLKLLIIADDFTGALDTGVQLSKKNIPATVLVEPCAIYEGIPKSEVIVVNADIRHLTPESAFSAINTILGRLYSPGVYVYIKTDSVLRGNISAAFAAAAAAVKKPICFIPAYPALGRTTADACAYVDGKRLEDSVFANDPRTPTTQSHIPSIINSSHRIKVIHVRQEDLSGLHINKDETDPTAYLFDCETDGDMQKTAMLLKKEDAFGLTAGCAGFASLFPDFLEFEKKLTDVNMEKRPSLFVSGSANAVTFAQLSYAKRHNYTVFSLSEKLNSYVYNTTETQDYKAFYENLPFKRLISETASILQKNKSVIIATATDKNELLDFDRLHKTGKNDEQIHNCIAEYTSGLVKSILEAAPSSNLVIFGGDMAAAILKKTGCRQVCAAGEIAPGVPLCRIPDEAGDMNIVTKSGGFGDEALIPLIDNYLKKG